MNLIGWIGTVGVLVGYWFSDKDKSLMDWANAIFFIPLMVSSISFGAYPAAAVNLAFGIIAIKSLWGHRGTSK